MKDSTRDILTPLLNVLRSYGILDEPRESSFHLNGRDYIHFHDDSDGLWADVRLSKGRIRVPVSKRSQQAELLEKICEKLDPLESQQSSRKSRRHRRG